MKVGPLHRLEEMIRRREPIDDNTLLETLGRDSTIVVPTQGGGERLLPSGEILSVLADGVGMPMEDVLASSFRMSPEEIAAASDFIRLVQFAGDTESLGGEEQPFQPFDR